jgi:hypothetical protein
MRTGGSPSARPLACLAGDGAGMPNAQQVGGRHALELDCRHGPGGLRQSRKLGTSAQGARARSRSDAVTPVTPVTTNLPDVGSHLVASTDARCTSGRLPPHLCNDAGRGS